MRHASFLLPSQPASRSSMSSQQITPHSLLVDHEPLENLHCKSWPIVWRFPNTDIHYCEQHEAVRCTHFQPQEYKSTLACHCFTEHHLAKAVIKQSSSWCLETAHTREMDTNPPPHLAKKPTGRTPEAEEDCQVLHNVNFHSMVGLWRKENLSPGLSAYIL